jgi:hypothetical protein
MHRNPAYDAGLNPGEKSFRLSSPRSPEESYGSSRERGGVSEKLSFVAAETAQ